MQVCTSCNAVSPSISVHCLIPLASSLWPHPLALSLWPHPLGLITLASSEDISKHLKSPAHCSVVFPSSFPFLNPSHCLADSSIFVHNYRSQVGFGCRKRIMSTTCLRQHSSRGFFFFDLGSRPGLSFKIWS